jgi:hypothetical protein
MQFLLTDVKEAENVYIYDFLPFLSRLPTHSIANLPLYLTSYIQVVKVMHRLFIYKIKN